MQKIVLVIFALSSVQILGAVASKIFGLRDGAIVSGFISGIISSTAATATLAKQSQTAVEENVPILTFSFLSATLAMVLEVLFLIVVGLSDFQPSLLILFIGPVGINFFLIVSGLNKNKSHTFKVQHDHTLKFSTTLKLALFIVVVLVLSRTLEHFFGEKGLFLFSFLVSLFEIHGSIISNVQLFGANAFNLQVLGTLISLSLIASYFSKMFLVWFLGSDSFQTKVLWPTLLVIISIVLSWLTFLMSVKP